MLGSAIFQLADREFDNGMVAVKPVRFGGVQVGAVRDEGVVSPRREQGLLGLVGEAGAAHHETHGAMIFLAGAAALIGGFSDLGEPAEGVVDVLPGVISNRGDSGSDLAVVGDGDRSGHLVTIEGAEQFP